MDGDYSYAKFTFTTRLVSKLRIYYLQKSEQNYDFAIISKPNATLQQSTSDEQSASVVLRRLYGIVQTDRNNPGIIDLDLTDVPEEFFITIKYRHDGSGIVNPDRVALKFEPIYD